MTDLIEVVCFRCGEEGEVDYDLLIGDCSYCKTRSTVSLRLAGDILNDLYLNGVLQEGGYLNEYE